MDPDLDCLPSQIPGYTETVSYNFDLYISDPIRGQREDFQGIDREDGNRHEKNAGKFTPFTFVGQSYILLYISLPCLTQIK